MSDETLELSDVEGFSYLMKCLWDKDHLKREQMAILDTIIYKEGRPFRWIFTNNEGFVVKKRDENITPNEVLRVFKQRARTMIGSKHHSLINKIALVWYVDARNNMQSHLLDDVQLKSFLEDNVYECLAVQLYIGGYPLKGSGVFQHRFWLRLDNSAGHETTELVSAAGPDLTIYMENTEKLTIGNTQHTTLKKLSKKVIKLLERSMGGTVASMVLQVAFSSSWTPFVVAAKSLLFWGADSRLALYRQASLYICDPPQPPSGGSSGSVFLPHKVDRSTAHRHGMPLTLPYRESRKTPGKLAAGIDATTGENLFDVIMDAPNTEGKRHDSHHHHKHGGKEDDAKGSDRDMERDLDSTLHKNLHDFGLEIELDHGRHHKLAEGAFITPTSSSHAAAPGLDSHGRHAALQGASTHKYEVLSGVNKDSRGIPEPNFDKHPVTGQFAQKAKSKYNDDDLLFIENKKNTAKGKNDRFYNGAAQRPLGASDAGPHYPQDLGNDIAHPVVENHQDTALTGDLDTGIRKSGKGSTVEKELQTRQSAAMSRLSTPAPGSSMHNDTLKRLRTVRPGSKKGAIHSHPAYGQTESSRARLEFYASQLRHVEALPLDELMKNRRAISAPHGVRRGRGGVPTEGPGITTTGTVDSPGVRNSRVLGKHGTEAGGRRSSGFERPVPLQSGTVCYGDYCFLGESGIHEESSSGDRDKSGFSGKNATSSPNNVSDISQPKASSSPSQDACNEDGVEGGVSALEMGSVAEAGREGAEGRTDGGSWLNSSSGKSNSPSKDQDNPFKHEDKVNPHNLQPPILPYQLPFRSVILLRAEENHLNCKLYEPWEFDGSVMESKAALDMKAQEFKIMDHKKRLLNLVQRHLRRIAYTCLSDVRKTVTSTPNVHTTGSGFTYQWQQLSLAYRKLVYADALSKTHPSRFYQTVPMCDCCQFVYSMADAFREEVVYGGYQPPSGQSSTNSPGKRKTKRNPDGSPGKHTNGIEEARKKGIEKRERADALGSFRSSRHSGRLPRSFDGYGELKNEECDGVFSHDDVDDMGYDDTRGVGYLDTLTEKYPIGVKENQAEDQGSTAQTGNVSAWVRMLTEEAASLSDGGGRASTAPTGTSRPAASQTGKPNPMGPLAGQGVGSPLGQYRDLAAPVGYMLGQSASDVGTKVIDENGNFIYQKKRSPGEIHGVSEGSNAAGKGSNLSGRRPVSANVGGPRNDSNDSMLKPNKDGIAFTKEISRASRQTTEQPSTAGMSHKGNQSQSYTKKGNAKSKAPIGNNIHGLMDIDQYEFKSASASRLFSEGASDRQGEGRSVKVAKTRTPVPKPISMPSSASGKDMSKTVSLEDYHFTSLPGTEAPLIPLTAYHLNNVGVGLSATS